MRLFISNETDIMFFLKNSLYNVEMANRMIEMKTLESQPHLRIDLLNAATMNRSREAKANEEKKSVCLDTWNEGKM